MTETVHGPVHFIGIGGVGQRATAEVLLDQGIAVQGSDAQDSATLDDLRRRGATVFLGHESANVGNAQLVVVSSAVPETNPEIVASRAKHIEVIKNAELLRRIGLGKKTLGVAGTHGKTTTTSMLAWILKSLNYEPTFVVGGVVRNLGCSGHAGNGDWFVVESDEYDRRFLSLDPWGIIVTNVEPDHIDFFGSVAAMEAAFQQFVARVPTDGIVVLCADDPGALALRTFASAPVATYGVNNGDWRAIAIERGTDRTTFIATFQNHAVAHCVLQVPGMHNVRNALACLALARAVGIDSQQAAQALTAFVGAGRRFDLIGSARGVSVLTDYGHLPTEIRATLESAHQRFPDNRLHVVFQPHTYARTRLLMDDFVTSLQDEPHRCIVGAYVPSGREQPNADVETRELARRLQAPYHAGRGALVDELLPDLQPGDVVLLIGAGDIHLAAQQLLDALQVRA